MENKGLDALFDSAPSHQSTSVPAKPAKFEKGTFYFDPADLALLEKTWLDLMSNGVKCNKSEIVSILLKSGLEEHQSNPTDSLLTHRLTGKRRRA